MHYWNIRLNEHKQLQDFLKSCCKGESVKQAKTFSQDDIRKFLNSPVVKSNCKYTEVRSALSVTALSGANRMDEIKR